MPALWAAATPRQASTTNSCRFAGGERAVLLQVLLGAGTGCQLHHEVVRLPVLGNFVNGDRIGMVQLAGAFRFIQKAIQQDMVGRQFARQHFDGNVAANGCVMGLEDDPHASCAQNSSDVVLAQPAPDPLCGLVR